MHIRHVFWLVFMMLILKARGFTQFLLRANSINLKNPMPKRIPGFGTRISASLNTPLNQAYSTSSPSLEAPKNVRKQQSVRRNNVVSVKARPYFLEQARLREASKMQDFIGGMQAYDKMVQIEDYPITVDDLCIAISMCCKAEHIPKAMEIAEKIRSRTTKSQEALWLGLIRCYSDAYQLRIAMQIIKKIPPADLKPRFFEPLLDAMKARGDFTAVLQLLRHMESCNVPFREDQLLTILQLCSSEQGKLAIGTDFNLRTNVTAVLGLMAKHIVGMNTQFIKETIMACTHQTLPQIEDDGVLVGTIADIPGTIAGFNADGTVTAINTTFLTDSKYGIHVNISALLRHGAATTATSASPAIPDNTLDSANITDVVTNTLSSALKKDQESIDGGGWATDVHCKLVPEKYRFASTAIHPNTLLHLSDATATAGIPTEFATITSSADADTTESPVAALATPVRARIVDISHTNTCPNCAGKMAPLPITEEERQSTRQTLFKRIGSIESAYLEEFGVFLRQNEQFDYIIDAANVAYQNQNYHDGKFKYEQLEWVYDELRKRTPRVLVVMSEIYARSSPGKVPNSAGVSRGVYQSQFTERDLRFLNKLREENALYLCPRGADDDLFWLYSTLYDRPGGHRSTSLVVTNDLMRDHKANAFDSGRVFMRWRTQHIVNFMVQYEETASTQQMQTQAPVQGEAKITERVSFFNSPSFSREIQASSTEGFWHVPATDRNLWLCVQATPREPFVTDSFF